MDHLKNLKNLQDIKKIEYQYSVDEKEFFCQVVLYNGRKVSLNLSDKHYYSLMKIIEVIKEFGSQKQSISLEHLITRVDFKSVQEAVKNIFENLNYQNHTIEEGIFPFEFN